MVQIFALSSFLGVLPLTPATGKAKGYVRGGSWPPDEKFFSKGAIGFTYYLQTWFRYYLQQWIDTRRGEIEAREGVYSWDFSKDHRKQLRGNNTDGSFIRDTETEVTSSHKDGGILCLLWRRAKAAWRECWTLPTYGR